MDVMGMPRMPGAGPVGRLLPGHRGEEEARVRQAAWVARCVGRGEAAPLRAEDVAALAGTLQVRELAPGQVAFKAGDPAAGVWIVRDGRVELAGGTRGARPGGAPPRARDPGGGISPRLARPPPHTGP